MTHLMQYRPHIISLHVIGFIGTLLVAPGVEAKSSSSPDGNKAAVAACDYGAHPTITSVTPKRVKPGQKITISGKNFGAKHCFHSVSFGPTSTDAWTYVSPTTVEATVPNLKPGTFPLTVSTEGGESQSTLEIQSK